MDVISRRRMLAGLAGVTGAALVVGCGGSTTAPAPSSTPTQGLGPLPRFPDGFNAPSIFATGAPQRLPYVLAWPDGYPVVDDAPDSVVMTVDGVDHEVHRHGSPGATPYYPLVFTPTSTGEYVVTLEGGRSHTVRIVDPTDVAVVQVGDALPAVDTPTVADARGVDPICTRYPQECPFHDRTVAEALAAPGPTAVLVSTPGYCTTDVCGPALEHLITASANLAGDWSVIHAEVYVAPTTTGGNRDLTPVISAFGMAFEPSLVVADASGTVTGTLHLAMDADEITATLATTG